VREGGREGPLIGAPLCGARQPPPPPAAAAAGEGRGDGGEIMIERRRVGTVCLLRAFLHSLMSRGIHTEHAQMWCVSSSALGILFGGLFVLCIVVGGEKKEEEEDGGREGGNLGRILSGGKRGDKKRGRGCEYHICLCLCVCCNYSVPLQV